MRSITIATHGNERPYNVSAEELLHCHYLAVYSAEGVSAIPALSVLLPKQLNRNYLLFYLTETGFCIGKKICFGRSLTHGIVKNRKSRAKPLNFNFHDSMSAIGFISEGILTRKSGFARFSEHSDYGFIKIHSPPHPTQMPFPATPASRFACGMKLEAIDPEKPALICAVSVVDVLGE